MYDIMINMKCLIEKCEKEQYVKGYCQGHYQRLRKYGNPLGGTRFNYGKGWITDSGYRLINKQREHRIVMEKILGRKLNKNEDVHHVDGNRLNNEPSNLVVLTKSVHSIMYSGRRKHFICTIEGCKNKHKSMGLCEKHYMYKLRHDNPKKCKGCGKDVFTKTELCNSCCQKKEYK